MLRPLVSLPAIALAATMSASNASAIIITTTPPDAVTEPGNAQGPAPFRFYGGGGSRVQQVYAADFFGSAQNITGFSFRPFPGFDPGAFFGDTLNISDITISFSTTPFGDETGTPLSASFADNVGGDALVVYSGPLSIMTAATGSPVRAFDYSVVLENPFAYDPALGNLLLDVLIPATATVTGNGLFGFITFDTVNTFNDGIYSVVNIFGGADAATGEQSTAGAITQFTGEPLAVPEPAVIALFGLGVLGIAARRRIARVSY